LKPGEEKACTFHPAMYKSGETLVAGTQSKNKENTVEFALARLELHEPRMQVA
jgi:hypothetical protein